MARDSLALLFGAYLNLDWDLEYGSVERGVEAFRRDEGANSAAEVVKQLDALLAAHPSEGELRSVLDGLGCGFFPTGSGLTYSAWLGDLRNQLAQT